MESFRARYAPRPSLRVAGFTLVELLVVLGIITMIMGIVLTSQGSFNRSIILANTAYDVALTIRSAETYGIASRASSASANTGYGVHFQAGSPNSFLFFADTYPAAACSTPGCTPPGDHLYTAGQDVLVQTYTLSNGMTIQDFCVSVSGSWQCVNNGGSVTSLDVSFARPNPSAYITKNGTQGGLTAACLLLASPQGTTRSVSIWSSGAISPNAAPCP